MQEESVYSASSINSFFLHLSFAATALVGAALVYSVVTRL